MNRLYGYFGFTNLRYFVLQAIEGSMQQLLDALGAMGRQDAVNIVREAFKYHKHGSFQGTC